MVNVTSNTDRLLHIPTGNREARVSRKKAAAASSTSEILERLSYFLLIEGPSPNVFIRRHVFACDRQRFYAMRALLVRLGYVRVGDDAAKTWTLSGPAWEEGKGPPTLPNIMPALEPQFARSNTHPGSVQVLCPLCGLFKKPWQNESRARAWYQEHIKTGVAHR